MSNKLVRRQRKPATHAQGKPVRGVRGPGVRGPNKTQWEIDREAELAKQYPRPLIISSPPAHTPEEKAEITNRLGPRPASTGSIRVPRSSRYGKILAELIQEIGSEQVNAETGWTRIEAVIRRLYADAMSGKTPAQALLFERGWGRVPLPMKVDFSAELKKVIAESGLTQADIDSDPLLKELIVEGQFVKEQKELPDDGPHPAGSPDA